MNNLAFLLFTPLVATLLLALIRSYKAAAFVNVLASTVTLLSGLSLILDRPETTTYFMFDNLNIYVIVLTTFVAFTASLFSVPYIEHELKIGRIRPKLMRLYHAVFQFFVFCLLMVLTSNNLGVMWVSTEGATLVTVSMIGLYRTPSALEAAWKYFILCGVGLALALFGTTLLYLAAQPIVGMGMPAMTWTTLLPHMSAVSPTLLNLAFVFLFIGYGTKVGLVPLNAWLPDAHAEGPTPISAVLCSLILNVAVYLILRFKLLMSGNPDALDPGLLMITVGIATFIIASFMLYRSRDIKRLFTYSTIEHMGIIVFTFGLGGALANFAALLHMATQSVTKSAIFYSVGRICQIRGTQEISKIRGLTSTQPFLGWALVFSVVAISGMPPFGVFMSEFLIISAAFAHHPFFVIPLISGLLISFGAMIWKLQGLAFGHSETGEKVDTSLRIPLFIHLALVLMAGIYLPSAFVAWLQTIAKILG